MAEDKNTKKPTPNSDNKWKAVDKKETITSTDSRKKHI
jgi:hypothetical protein